MGGVGDGGTGQEEEAMWGRGRAACRSSIFASEICVTRMRAASCEGRKKEGMCQHAEPTCVSHP